jgi:hypothetical protein
VGLPSGRRRPTSHIQGADICNRGHPEPGFRVVSTVAPGAAA